MFTVAETLEKDLAIRRHPAETDRQRDCLVPMNIGEIHAGVAVIARLISYLATTPTEDSIYRAQLVPL